MRVEKIAAAEQVQWLLAPPPHIPFHAPFPPDKAQAIGLAAGCQYIDHSTLFSFFISHEQSSLLVKHTNMYAASHEAGLASIYHPFICKWYPTYPSELLVFLGNF